MTEKLNLRDRASSSERKPLIAKPRPDLKPKNEEEAMETARELMTRFPKTIDHLAR